jgi:hypothetical protein
MLLGVSFDFIRRSFGGFAQQIPMLGDALHKAAGVVAQIPFVGDWLVGFLSVDVAPPEVAGPLFPVLVAITIASIVLSRIACNAQIRVGRKTGHTIVTAAGEEMKADSRIEIATLVGIILEKLLPGWPILEYIFGLWIAFKIAGTGWELMQESWRALMAKSIGSEIDETLRAMCLRVPGVCGVVTLGTFRVGPLAVVKVTLNTMLHRAIPVMTEAIECQLKHYVTENGYVDCQVDVMFKKPAADEHRIAYAVRVSKAGEIELIAGTTKDATHIAVADMQFDESERVTLDPIPADLPSFLTNKRVRTLYVFDADKQRENWNCDTVKIEAASSYIPAVLGLTRD